MLPWKCLGRGLALSLAIAIPAAAGPNAGGTIFCHDASQTWSVGGSTYCGAGVGPGSCPAADTEIDGATATVPAVWKVYVAFPEGSSPRLMAMVFGIHYDDSIHIIDGDFCFGDGPCPSWGCDYPGPGWPGSDTGDVLAWPETQTTTLVEAYWFAGYNYGGSPATFRLRDHPDPLYGGQFLDDSNPAQLDSIAAYGSIGFDQPGETACPQVPVPIVTRTWGGIKSTFR